MNKKKVNERDVSEADDATVASATAPNFVGGTISVSGDTAITASTDMRPGAFRVGGFDQSDGFTVNQSSIVTTPRLLNDDILEDNHPLEAEIVQEREDIIQQRMKDRTVDAATVERLRTSNTTQQGSTNLRRHIVIVSALAFAILIILLVLALILPELMSKDDANVNNDSETAPTASPTTFDSRNMKFALNLLSPISGQDSLLDETTAQYRAINWLINDDPDKENWFSAAEVMSSSMSIEFNPDADRSKPSSSSNTSPRRLIERYVTAVFYFATGGPGWNWNDRSSNFLNGNDTCDWYSEFVRSGVSCNEDSFITSFEFGPYFWYDEDIGLNGTIPQELATLSSLETLYVSGFGVHGTLPSSIGALRNLQRLEIYGTAVGGSIPKSYGSIPSLEYLLLALNALTGTIPDQLLHQLTSLRVIDFHGNRLSGRIPKLTSLLQDLEDINLFDNMFSGVIPESIYQIQKLKFIDLLGNGLSGSLSTEVGNLQDLLEMNLAENHLSGTIPTELSRQTDLEFLYLDANLLSGTIPTEFGVMTSLFDVWLHSNMIGGTVPSELLLLRDINSIRLEHNNITGDLGVLCNRTDVISEVIADCLGDTNGVDPEVECACCTICCNDALCVANPEANCNVDKSWFEHWPGLFYVENAGTQCDCRSTFDPVHVNDTTTGLYCADMKCQVCNSNGTICATQEYGIVYGDDGSWNGVWATFAYVIGLDNDVVVKYQADNKSKPRITVNDGICNSAGFVTCDTGFKMLAVDCTNLDGVGALDPCSSALGNSENGPLAVIAMQDPSRVDKDACTSRIIELSSPIKA